MFNNKGSDSGRTDQADNTRNLNGNDLNSGVSDGSSRNPGNTRQLTPAQVRRKERNRIRNKARRERKKLRSQQNNQDNISMVQDENRVDDNVIKVEIAHGRSFSTKNYSLAFVSKRAFNNSAIVETYNTITNRTVLIRYTIVPDVQRLKYQAQVWAKKIRSMQNLILRYVVNSYNEQWQAELEKCYIYSYYKSLLYALQMRNTNGLPNNTLVVSGHAVMHKALLSDGFTYQTNGINVKHEFVWSQDNVDQIMAQAREFDYLANSIQDVPFFQFVNVDLDRYLGKLQDQIGNSGPQFMSFSDYSNVSKHLTQDTFPLGNSMYKSGNDISKWFYCYNSSSHILDPILMIGKALFITSVDDDTNGIYYDSISQDDNLALVKYEVSAVAGSVYEDPTPETVPVSK